MKYQQQRGGQNHRGNLPSPGDLFISALCTSEYVSYLCECVLLCLKGGQERQPDTAVEPQISCRAAAHDTSFNHIRFVNNRSGAGGSSVEDFPHCSASISIAFTDRWWVIVWCCFPYQGDDTVLLPAQFCLSGAAAALGERKSKGFDLFLCF